MEETCHYLSASYDWEVVGINLPVSEVHSITAVRVHKRMRTNNLVLQRALVQEGLPGSKKRKHTPRSLDVQAELVLSSEEEMRTI